MRQTSMVGTEFATDPDAFEAFYREHLPVVRTYLARRVEDPSVIADLTADVFLAAIESSSAYQADLGTPRAWLIGVARNVLAGHRRSRGRELAAMAQLAGRRDLDEDSTLRIVERVASEGPARATLAAIRRLPRGLRDVAELMAVDGLSTDEAATLLGISAGATRVRYHRARKKLLSTLDQLLEEET